MIYTDEIAGILFNSLVNIKDCKLLILKYITAIIIKLIIYKPLDIFLLKLFLIL